MGPGKGLPGEPVILTVDVPPRAQRETRDKRSHVVLQVLGQAETLP